MKKGSNVIMHLLQHVCLVGGVAALIAVFFGAFVYVDGKDGTEYYEISAKESGIEFEDSELFNQILGNSVTDIICFGAIRGQMETDGQYDPVKPVDVTAFADRYTGLKTEYITAEYFLEDLIKWDRYGFETEEVYMTGKEVDDFLSRKRTVTVVDFSDGNYSGGTVSYLNSDVEKMTQVKDVSGNVLLEDGQSLRDNALANVMKNRYLTTEGKTIESHVSSWDEYYELCTNVQRAAEDLNINYEEYLKYKEYYDADNSNVVYFIRKTIGKDVEVYSNQKVTSEKASAVEKQLKELCSSYIIYDPENMVYETNTRIEEDTLRYVLNGYEYAYPDNTQIYIGVVKDFHASDAFSQARKGYNNYSPNFWQYLIGGIVAILLYLLLLVVLTIEEGKVKIKSTGETVIRLKREDKIPTEMMLILAIAAAAVIVFTGKLVLGSSLFRRMYGSEAEIIVIACLGVLCISLAFSFFYYSLVRRIKARTLWKNSLLRRLYKWIKVSLLHIYDNAAVVLRVWVPFCVFILINVLLIGLFEVQGVVIAGIIDVLIGVFLYKSAQDRQRILRGIEKINSGDMEHQIDETGLHGDNLILANAVNGIGESIRTAVATSMKDERMKADLITNVSHDIKTPLTSIINYVDLIKRENVDNPKVKEYIEILDVKSQRLKQLTDDLVEASKISSGNIVLSWEKINLVELLNQTIGEFSEKFEEKSLTPVLRTAKNSMLIEADSRRIWRVIENLFNNIFKYALTGTRVYIDLQEMQTEGGRFVTLSILNISANPIKVNTEELTERFIRGDESRTTEGSGLGLSIAKNLTEVQKGKFEIMVDGDLFKVVLTFPLLENQ